MSWLFILVSTLAWGIAEIFYKKGNLEKERYSHLKTTVFVGFFMGVYALVILFTQGVDLKLFPKNFLIYLPVALCYIVSMVCSYFGVRFIEESISDPIENSSCAIVAILSALILHETYEIPAIVSIVIIVIGLVAVSLFDKNGKDIRHKKFGKKLAIFAIAMPFCYMLLDAAGTFLDIFYTDDVTTTLLVGVTEETIEHTANCAYELTFFLVSIGILVFLKIKKVKLLDFGENSQENKGFFCKIIDQKWKILAAVFETIGQATYLFALSDGGAVAAVLLGAGTVITSLILSRLFLKEKLTWIQYVFVGIIMCGIIMGAIFGL